MEKQTHLWQHTSHHLYCPETWKHTLPSSWPPPPAKKLTEESVPPHAAPTIRVLTGVCVRSGYTLATTNTSTLSTCKGLSADKDLEKVHSMCHLHAKHWGSSLKVYHAQQPNSSTYEYWSKRNERRDWSGGSALESTGCSCRDPGLVLRPTLQLTTICSSNSGDPMASSGLEKHCIHMMKRHMCRPNTCTHKINLFKDMSMHVHQKLCNAMKARNGTKLHRKWVRKNIVSGIVCHTKTHP